MDFFQWDEKFLTGLSTVDEQHRFLINLINDFGTLLSKNKIVYEDVESLIKELVQYSEYHFREEIKYMFKMKVDLRHVEPHIKSHKSFIQEVTSLYSGVTKDDLSSARYLLNFLTTWLAYHILGSDQNMARQVSSIQSGATPEEAFDSEEKAQGVATKLLLQSLDSLFDQVSARNKKLVLLNESLEEKVKQRTSELVKANKLLHEISLTDELTQLPNRRNAMEKLSLLWYEAIKDNTSLTCMMVDADHFKEINDTYGHDAGDKVLKDLARGLLHSFRNDDIVCRLGGDEFFIICPDTDAKGGMNIANLTCSRISKLRVPTGGEPWHGSVSIGVASRSSEMNSYDELIKLADKGLYLAKERGKGRAETVVDS